MATEKDFREGAEKLLVYLAGDFDDNGVSRSAPDNVQFYYKLPAILAYGGRRALALKTLHQFETRFVRDGRMILDSDAASWLPYIAGWASWGAAMLGRFDRARDILATALDDQDPQWGGFWAETEKGRVLDVQRSSGAAMACCWSHESFEKGLLTAKFLIHALDSQPDDEIFYSYFDKDAKAVVADENRMAHFGRNDQHAFPAMFGATVACLVWMGRATGDAQLFEAAHRYLKIVLSNRHDPATMPLATKFGWSALLLSPHIDAPELADFARRVGTDLLERQQPDGSIAFDTIPGFQPPLDKVWLVGWGCDSLLTLAGLGNGEA